LGAAPSAYEALVGWRYLLRQRRSRGVLVVGVPLLAVGLCLVGYGVHLQQAGGGAVSVFGNSAASAQLFMGVGGGLSAVGGALTLFGVLNYFLTVFAAFSTFMITIGVAEVILVLAVMNGFQGDLRSKIIDTHAHIVIESAQKRGRLSGYQALATQARGVEGVLGATPVLTTEVMLRAPTNLSAVILTGIDIESIGSANKLPTFLEHGSLGDLTDPEGVEARAKRRPSPRSRRTPVPQVAPGPAEPNEALGDMAFPLPKSTTPPPPPTVLLGHELRTNLALWPGETFDIVSPFGELGPQGPVPKSRPFRLAGWFASGMLEFDSRLAYAHLPVVQRFMGIGDEASSIQIRVANLDMARPVRDRLQAALGASVKVSDWQERNRNLFSALKLEKIAMFLVLTINILLAAFSITSTLVMTIIERKREIAILSAMGSTQRSIVRIFMAQGGLTGLLGSAIGATLGVLGALGLSTMRLPLNNDVYYISAIPVDIRVTDVLAIVTVAILVSLISTIYPAIYAAGLRPVEGLNA
jgi:lipoprotein-releasing system permease protein